MLDQIRYLASWTSVKLSKRLGQRGAEMVEYAIVLACIAVLGTWFYGNRDKAGNSNAGLSLWGALDNLWKGIAGTVKNAQ